MSYHRQNHIRRLRYIVDVYNAHKHYDVTDSYIIRNIFPKHNIYLSYRAWMKIKGTPLSATPTVSDNQLSLFI